MLRRRLLDGLSYQNFLKQLHDALGAIRYFEIGTQFGESLRHAKGPTVAVDPNFKIDWSQWTMRPDCVAVEKTSDAYFEECSPEAHLGGAIDLAFIDGMHLSEFVLRDFLNVERHCSRDGMILLHDALPINFEMSERIRDPANRIDREFASYWTGDVWRVLPILMRLRPDLRIDVLDCAPTGLVVIRDLDPASDRLAKELPGLVAELTASEPSEAEFWEFYETLHVTSGQSWLHDNAAVLASLRARHGS